MRIERTGSPARLTPRLSKFFKEELGGEALDDVQHPERRKADFRCFRGLMAIELKTLETDPTDRMDNLTDELRKRPDWPIFLGSAPIQSFLQHLDDRKGAERLLLDRIERPIKQHLSKADKQLGAYQADFRRRNSIKIVVLVNEDHELYEPKLTAHLVQRFLLRSEDGQPLHKNIDGVVFLSERHATRVQGQIAFPIVWIEGPTIDAAPWKRDVINLMFRKWAQWNGLPIHKSEIEDTFATIEDVPNEMKRYERWELEYKRNPYMRSFTIEQVRERFDEAVCISTLKFVKGSPVQPPDEAVMWSMSSISHLMLEMGRRGIPITEFQYTPQRLAAAASRMKMPEMVVDWLQRDMGRLA